MKPKTRRIVSSIISIGYILLGLFIWDWSFRMVPFNSTSSKASIISTVILCFCYIFCGVLFLIGIFLIHIKKNIGVTTISLTFWGALITLLIGCVIIWILINVGKISSLHSGDIIFYVTLFIPSLFIYLNRKKMEQV